MASRRTRRVGEHEVECAELFEEPAKILSLLNRHLYRSTQPEKYATLFLAHYDGLSRRLVYANGGHLPPMLLRANDTVTYLDRGGSVVGLLDELSWEQGTEHLGPGDILIAYSDGVTEPENDFGEFGENRLLEVVRRHRHLSLEAISEQVIQTLRTWIGAQEQPDDVTLVLARQR
jgi:sigma-B regulation protein RsbU (phosphoserine phosphatase)